MKPLGRVEARIMAALIAFDQPMTGRQLVRARTAWRGSVLVHLMALEDRGAIEHLDPPGQERRHYQATVAGVRAYNALVDGVTLVAAGK